MAAYYFDRNGQTLGFGTLTQTVNVSNPPIGSTNSSGIVIPGGLASGSTAHTYSFGSPDTNASTTPGTFTFSGTGTFTANGIFYQNLTGNQTWTKTTGNGALTLGGTNPFIEVTATGKLIFSVFPLQGTVNWEKRGASTLQLNAANTFSGGMTISAGTVEIGNASALGTGTVTMTGGKLSSSSTTGYTLANALTLNGTMTLGDATNTGALTFGGTTTISGATTLTTSSSVAFTGAITVDASVNATVNNADAGSAGAFRGATTINGTLTSANGNLFGYHTNASAANVTINTGGTLTNGSNSHLTTVGPLVMAGGTLTSGAQQVAGSAFSGAYILRGNVTATGNSAITGFPIAIGVPSDTTITGTINVSSGKTLAVSANIVNSVNLVFSAAVTTNIAQQTGTGTLTLTGANTFTGTVSVSTGTLNANSATALGSDVSSVSVTSGATLSLGAAPTYSTRSLAVSGTGVSSTVGALVINNTGTSNTFQSITLGGATYIRATSSGVINAPFTSNNNSLILGASAGSDFIPFASLSNVFSGLGAVTYGGHSLDTGIVRADVRHTYTGNTTLAYGTTYVDSSLELATTGGPLGNKSLTAANTLLMTGGTLSYLGGSVDYSGRFSTAGGQQWKIDAAGQTVTYATALVGASSLSLNDTSTGGSLTLSSASSTFSGGVTITSGTLYAGAAQSGVSGPLGITGTITFSPAGTGVLAYTSASASFDYSSRFATSSGQSRRINANGESVTFSTALGGTNAFALVGSAGFLTLAVANTYTQGTTLSVGVLKCGNVASLGTGGLAQANGTTLHVTATGGKLTIDGAHTNTGTGSRIIRIGA